MVKENEIQNDSVNEVKVDSNQIYGFETFGKCDTDTFLGNKQLKEKLENNGVELDEVSYFVSPYFVDAIVGISDDNRLIYDYDLMIEAAMKEENWTEEEAIDWIEFNTIRTIPYMENGPIILNSFYD